MHVLSAEWGQETKFFSGSSLTLLKFPAWKPQYHSGDGNYHVEVLVLPCQLPGQGCWAWTRRIPLCFVSGVSTCCSCYLCPPPGLKCSLLHPMLDALIAHEYLSQMEVFLWQKWERIYKARTSPCINSYVQYVTCLVTNRIILPAAERRGKEREKWDDTQHDKDTTLIKDSCMFISQQGIIAQK